LSSYIGEYKNTLLVDVLGQPHSSSVASGHRPWHPQLLRHSALFVDGAGRLSAFPHVIATIVTTRVPAGVPAGDTQASPLLLRECRLISALVGPIDMETWTAD